MEKFKFVIGCSGKGYYCDIRKTFFGDSAEEAERKAKEYVETLIVPIDPPPYQPPKVPGDFSVG